MGPKSLLMKPRLLIAVIFLFLTFIKSTVQQEDGTNATQAEGTVAPAVPGAGDFDWQVKQEDGYPEFEFVDEDTTIMAKGLFLYSYTGELSDNKFMIAELLPKNCQRNAGGAARFTKLSRSTLEKIKEASTDSNEIISLSDKVDESASKWELDLAVDLGAIAAMNSIIEQEKYYYDEESSAVNGTKVSILEFCLSVQYKYIAEEDGNIANAIPVNFVNTKVRLNLSANGVFGSGGDTQTIGGIDILTVIKTLPREWVIVISLISIILLFCCLWSILTYCCCCNRRKITKTTTIEHHHVTTQHQAPPPPQNDQREQFAQNGRMASAPIIVMASPQQAPPPPPQQDPRTMFAQNGHMASAPVIIQQPQPTTVYHMHENQPREPYMYPPSVMPGKLPKQGEPTAPTEPSEDTPEYYELHLKQQMPISVLTPSSGISETDESSFDSGETDEPRYDPSTTRRPSYEKQRSSKNLYEDYGGETELRHQRHPNLPQTMNNVQTECISDRHSRQYGGSNHERPTYQWSRSNPELQLEEPYSVEKQNRPTYSRSRSNPNLYLEDAQSPKRQHRPCYSRARSNPNLHIYEPNPQDTQQQKRPSYPRHSSRQYVYEQPGSISGHGDSYRRQQQFSRSNPTLYEECGYEASPRRQTQRSYTRSRSHPNLQLDDDLPRPHDSQQRRNSRYQSQRHIQHSRDMPPLSPHQYGSSPSLKDMDGPNSNRSRRPSIKTRSPYRPSPHGSPQHGMSPRYGQPTMSRAPSCPRIQELD